MSPAEIQKLAETSRESRTATVNSLGGRLTNAEKKKREQNSHSLIDYDMREVDASQPDVHIFQVRLSEDEKASQRTNSVSVARQERDICSYARSLGFKLDTDENPGIINVGEYILEPWKEHGSASKNIVRPDFDALMDFIKSFTGTNPLHLWVYEVSRLTRRRDVAPGLIKTLFERGVVLHVVTKPWIDISTDRGREDLAREIEYAEREAESIKIRSMNAHNYRAQNGYFRGGPAPLGYKNVVLEGQKHPTLVLNEEPRADYPNDWSEVDLVQMMFAKAIEGNSTAAIARWLNGLSVPTVKGAKGWDNRTVKQVLKNARYAGFQTHKQGKQTWSKNNIDFIVKDHAGNYVQSHVALIKPEDFFAANAVLDTRYTKRRKYNTSRLAGIIVCAKCGSKMVMGTGAAHKNGKRYTNYRCMGKTAGICDTNNIPALGVEAVVRDIVRGYLSNPEKKRALLATLDAPVEDSEERKELLALIAAQQAKLDEAGKYEKAGIAATIKAMQDDLAKVDGGRKARIAAAKSVVNELAEFDRAWDDEKQRLTVNLTILSIIREVRVQPRNPGDEILNRYELAKRGWSCNYERVDLLLADGTVIDLDVEWGKILTQKVA
jgi:DNA invertase Pin-like site-specific DNA recombinase